MAAWIVAKTTIHADARTRQDEIRVEMHGQDDSFILTGSKNLIDSLQKDHDRLRGDNRELSERLDRVEETWGQRLTDCEDNHRKTLARLDSITTDYASLAGWVRESIERVAEGDVSGRFPPFHPQETEGR